MDIHSLVYLLSTNCDMPKKQSAVISDIRKKIHTKKMIELMDRCDSKTAFGAHKSSASHRHISYLLSEAQCLKCEPNSQLTHSSMNECQNKNMENVVWTIQFLTQSIHPNFALSYYISLLPLQIISRHK